MTRAIVYTASTCHACYAAIAYLWSLGVEVEERDASRLPQEVPSVVGLPVVVVGGRIIVGYAPSEIRKAVEEARP